MQSLRSVIQSQQSFVLPRRLSKEGLTITRLVCRQEWKRLEKYLKNDPDSLPIDDATDNFISKDLVVHFACRFQSPLSTIKLLAETFPGSLKHADATGRFPVHIASKWGASPEVIHFLIKSNPHTAGIQDDFGKTPMHYVGESYAKNYVEIAGATKPVDESMLLIVKMLRTAAPKSMNLEDNEGVNAIEYAIENEVDLKVIKAMQRACRDDWREMKKQHLGRSHAELEKDLERMAADLQMNLLQRRYEISSTIIEQQKKLNGNDSRIHIPGKIEPHVQAARMA